MDSNLIKMLRLVDKNSSESYLRKQGVFISKLMSKGLVVKKRDIKKKIIIPEGAPRWANKFRLSRKKYGVVEEKVEENIIVLTAKGKKLLSNTKFVA